MGKIIVLREICDAKDTLFGPFSSERTVQMKCKIWTNIVEKAKSLGLVATCKDYKYMRDVFWQNIKRQSLNKRENMQIHGKEFKRSPIDDLVYDIIDNTSSLHQQQTSLQNHETFVLSSAKPAPRHSVMLKTDHLDLDFIKEDEHEETANILIDETAEVTIEKVDQSEDDQFHQEDDSSLVEDEPPFTNGAERAIYVYDRSKQKIDEGKLKKRKLQLEIDFLELQNYKTQLEVLDLESKLGITPSKFTKEIAKRRKKNNMFTENKDVDSD